MRRILILALVATTLAAIPAGSAVAAEKNSAGALQAAFQTRFGAAWTISPEPGFGLTPLPSADVAAPAVGDEGRIVNGGEYCSDQLLGTWLSFLTAEGDRDEFTGIEMSFTLDEVELGFQTTAIKHTAKSLQDIGPIFGEDLRWWRNYGVPVLGTLPAGGHHLDIDVVFSGVPVAQFDIDFEVIDCPRS